MILILFSSIAFAQTQEDIISDPPNSYKFDEFGLIPEKVWKSKFDELLIKQDSKCEEQIFLFLYGNKKTLNKVGKKYLDYLVKTRVCDLDPRKIFIVFGGKRKKQWTEIWIVPLGANLPVPTIK
ncbi:MAG TPA: hypothetical protein PKY82_32615 [Pyrinomonadaceae bacterium]|nr:hypothetical protein [Pyrinomonadaceae bacterium]